MDWNTNIIYGLEMFFVLPFRTSQFKLYIPTELQIKYTFRFISCDHIIVSHRINNNSQSINSYIVFVVMFTVVKETTV